MLDGFWFIERELVEPGMIRNWDESRPREAAVANQTSSTAPRHRISRTPFNFSLEGAAIGQLRQRLDVVPALERSVAARMERQLRDVIASRVATASMGPLDNPNPLTGTTAIKINIPPRLDQELPCRLGREKAIAAIMAMQDRSHLALHEGSHVSDPAKVDEPVVGQVLPTGGEQIVSLSLGDVLVMDARLVIQFMGTYVAEKTEQYVVLGFNWPCCADQPDGHVVGSDTTLQSVIPKVDFPSVVKN